MRGNRRGCPGIENGRMIGTNDREASSIGEENEGVERGTWDHRVVEDAFQGTRGTP